MSSHQPSAAAAPQLVALDWGTSNLRASLLGAGGQVLETRAASPGSGGIMAVPERRFDEALHTLCGDWLGGTGGAAPLPAIASGMIGSRQGWVEAPYIACPAGLADAATQLTRIPLSSGGTLHVVPGLRCVGANGHDDVMRGEETQLWGAHLPAGSCCVLPGTHSKWAWTGAGGAVLSFQTYMTGELYALLTQHGILGRLMEFGQARPEAFARGVATGLAGHTDATHAIFAARTAGLMNQVAPDALPDFLSGILIGVEVGSATQRVRPAQVTLLGDDALCARYAAALEIAQIGRARADAGATTRGQWRVAEAAGLVAERKETA